MDYSNWQKADEKDIKRFPGALNCWKFGQDNWYLVQSGICAGDLLLEWSLYQGDMQICSSDCGDEYSAQRWAMDKIFPL